MTRIDDARFVARFAWPGVLGILLSLAWPGVPYLDGDASSVPAVIGIPVGVLITCSLLVLPFLYPLAILCVVLAPFRRGRARWLVLLANGAFLLISAAVLLVGPGIP
ncbi:MAG TPA: hypothetical protein VFY93_16120 [Planctomycetota bacterium]|nr:hypothetical protein [Planctomycetota bacterium]